MKFDPAELEQLLAVVKVAAEREADLTLNPENYEAASLDDLTSLIQSQQDRLTKLQSDRDIITTLSQLFGRAAADLDRSSTTQRIHKRRAEEALRKQRLLQAEQDYLKGLEPNLNNPELQRLYQILQTWQHYNELDSYQEDDIIFMLDRWLRTRDQAPNYDNTFTRGIINGNATGMGKTVETVAFLWVMRQLNPKCNILWLTKTSLTKETAPESSQRWHFDMIPATGTSPDKVNLINMLSQFPIPMTIAINYEAVNVVSVREALLAHSWEFVVIDEVHKLRGGANHTPTGIWKNTKNFLHETRPEQSRLPWPIMLSGSIINNEIGELWAYLHIMDPDRFPSIRQFRDAFESGAFTTEKLIKILAPSMFRRRKDEVHIKMPERIVKPHLLEMDWDSQLGQMYESLTEELFAAIESEGELKTFTLNNMLQKLHYQRALLMAPERLKIKRKVTNPQTLEVTEVEEIINPGRPFKLEYIIELASELLLEGENIVIATAQYTAPLRYIEDKLQAQIDAKTLPSHIKFGRIYGDNAKNGGEVSQQFRNNEIQVIFTNIPSGAEGFNWQQSADWPGGAANLIMCDDWWNPAKLDQLLDRVWRRGAVNRVIIHLIQVEETVDMTIKAIRELKLQNAEAITESTTLRAKDWKQILSDTLRRKDRKAA